MRPASVATVPFLLLILVVGSAIGFVLGVWISGAFTDVVVAFDARATADEVYGRAQGVATLGAAAVWDAQDTYEHAAAMATQAFAHSARSAENLATAEAVLIVVEELQATWTPMPTPRPTATPDSVHIVPHRGIEKTAR
jgi:hypothetical protein